MPSFWTGFLGFSVWVATHDRKHQIMHLSTECMSGNWQGTSSLRALLVSTDFIQTLEKQGV